MMASRLAISSVSLAMDPSISSIAVFESDRETPRPFLLSSLLSNFWTQYSFLLSSSCCSVLRCATMPSIMPTILSKPLCFPRSASATRPSSGRAGRWFPRAAAACSAASARARNEAAVTCTCRRLAPALGNVFLNMSRASSSFRTLMVSDSATSSSARACLTASHSLPFAAQPFSSSARNLVSAASDSCVSSRSFPIPAISTPSRPSLSISSSICLVRVATSFSLAATSPSQLCLAPASSDAASALPCAISSLICFSTPTISWLCGT
mmetsp:Transcript_110146/g.311425  ORF Transcript_110146/g.311425 Transcript_110146/m.311425 type:complete len:267 (-) Transcript_110146:210-1010(-)